MPSNIPFKASSLPFPKLAPDLTWPSDKAANNQLWERINGIDGTSGLTTALSLTGKFVVSYLWFANMTAEPVTIKLTVDGEVVWNDSFSMSTTNIALLGSNSADDVFPEFFVCEKSFLLEVATTADNNILLDYLARPIS